MARAAPVSAANPPIGCSFVIFVPIVLMMRHPPDSVPRAIAALASRIDPVRNGELAAGVSIEEPSREERARDDAHRLLRVVGAVHQAEGRRRDELHLAEESVDPARRLTRAAPTD